MKNYDIIGDIHGHADKLERLLKQLGYTKRGGAYQHPDTMAVFLGDFIDRGPQQCRVIEIVRCMVENGHALAVMGNHEFNAICYHTPDPDNMNEFLRPHTEKNTLQHQQFLNEFPVGHKHTKSVIKWFLTLPMYLELETIASSSRTSSFIRIVHACWDQQSIDRLCQHLNNDNQFTRKTLYAAARQGNQVFEAIETLLKGPEIPLPERASFKDKDGIKRYNIRYKWWGRAMNTYREAALVPVDEKQFIPDSPLPDSFDGAGYAASEAPVFFGHYWMTGQPTPLADNIACLDFSAGKQGPLVAYRWINDPKSNKLPLTRDHFFVSV